jgi:hypothetical protein
MSDRVPDRIAVAYTLTARDYVAYAAAIDRRSRSWAGFTISVAVLFSAIPVALLFRTLAAQRTHDAELIELVGRSSLFAFALAILASWIGAAVSTQLARRKYYKRWASQSDSRTVVLEPSGITLTSRTSHSNLQWSAVTGISGMRDLLLIWIEQERRSRFPPAVLATMAHATRRRPSSARGWRTCRPRRDRAPQPLHRQPERTDRASRHGAPRIWTSLDTIDYERKMTLRREPSSFHWIASGRVEPYLTLDP